MIGVEIVVRDAVFTKGLVDWPINPGGVQPVLAVSAARKLIADYNGPLIRVIRSTDEAEADIGTDSLGRLDEAALLAFVGGANGFIHTLYSQVGSAIFQRPALVSAPLIAQAGAVIKRGGRPAMVMEGNRYLASSGAGALTSDQGFVDFHTVGTVEAVPTGAQQNTGVLFSDPTGSSHSVHRLIARASPTMLGVGTRRTGAENRTTVEAAYTPSVDPRVIRGKADFAAGMLSGELDGVSMGSAAMVSAGKTQAPANTAGMHLGFLQTPTNGALHGTVSELVLFTADASEDADALSANQRRFYRS